MEFTDWFDGAIHDGIIDLTRDCCSSSNCGCFDSVCCIDHLLLFFVVIILVSEVIVIDYDSERLVGIVSGVRVGSCFFFERRGAVELV